MWSLRLAVDTVDDVPIDADKRRAYLRDLGENVARIRQSMTKLTQEDMADALGMNIETYGRVERGKREPKAYELVAIADHLGVPREWLVDPAESFKEIDARIAILRRVATEAAASAAADEIAQQAEGGKAARRGRR